MKLTRVIMYVMLLSMISSFVAAQDKKLEKEVKDRVKELKKEGWKAPSAGLPMEDQVRKSFKLQREEDSNYQRRYITGYAIGTGSLYNGAKGEATTMAKAFLADQINTELSSAVDNMMENRAISLEEVNTVSNLIMTAKTTVKQRLYNIIPVMELCRTNKHGNVEILVELAYDKKKAFQQFLDGEDSNEGNNQILLANYVGDKFYNGNGVEQDGDEALKWFEIAAKEGSAKAQAMINSIEKSKPIIEWLSDDNIVNSNVYKVKAGVKSTSKIKRSEITINGLLFRDLSIVEDDGYDMRIDKTVVLNKGRNTIVISAKNDNGTAKIEKNITYDPTYSINTPQTYDKRVALIIGNSNYNDSDKSLRNPKNDATDISAKLRTLGFDVITIIDAGKQTIEQKLYEFGEKAKTYDAALFYYAGHGIQNKGVNYLIPVDAKLRAEDEIPYHCVDANLVLDKMESAGCKTKIVILDACRNNPFARSWHRSLGNETQGLSKMDAPNGIFIGYATGPGQVAQDGKGRNSPYTQALLKMLDKPNQTLGSFYIGVVNEVKNLTNNQQWPWQSNSLDGEFFFNKKSE